jgi:hypothetical protein
MATVSDNLIVAHSCLPEAGCTYTYTLASRAGEILHQLEERFGPRDHSFTFLGIEFSETGPRNWFTANCKHIVIQLSTSAMNDEIRALYQLSHECVHLLDPVEWSMASVFEEGVAAMFSLEYTQNISPAYSPFYPKYNAAANLAKEALMISPGVIRHLRGNGVRFSEITSEQLKSVCSGLSPDICRLLSAKFQTWESTA